jgi:hypothetical protein
MGTRNSVDVESRCGLGGKPLGCPISRIFCEKALPRAPSQGGLSPINQEIREGPTLQPLGI